MSHAMMKVAYRPAGSRSPSSTRPRRATLTLLLALCYSATALGLVVFGIGAVLTIEDIARGPHAATMPRGLSIPQGWHTETISQHRLGGEFARQQANLVHRRSFH